MLLGPVSWPFTHCWARGHRRSHPRSQFREELQKTEHLGTLGSPHSLEQPKGGKNPDQLPVSGVVLYFKGKGMGLTSDGDAGKARVLFS